MRDQRCLYVFTKPAVPGRVKTRLIGDLTSEQAAALHGAFVEDLVGRLRSGPFSLRLAWALEPGQQAPSDGPEPAVVQEGADLGERLYRALSGAGAGYPYLAAVGSDHPHLPLDLVERAFAAVEGGADVALGPAEDGGYYLVAVRAETLSPRLFADIPWSTEEVLELTLERCRELGLDARLLPMGWDVDTPPDLERLARVLAEEPSLCPRTWHLLRAWGRLSLQVTP